jgi:threonyl-tRNA synthetase
LGHREAEEDTVSVRHRDLGDLGTTPTDEFVNRVVEEIERRLIKPAK